MAALGVDAFGDDALIDGDGAGDACLPQAVAAFGAPHTVSGGLAQPAAGAGLPHAVGVGSFRACGEEGLGCAAAVAVAVAGAVAVAVAAESGGSSANDGTV